jgi:hypothetical protein
VAAEIADSLFEVGLERGELQIDRPNVVLTNASDPRLGVGETDAPPVRHDPTAGTGHRFEVGMFGVDQLLAGGQEFALGSEGVGSLGLLLRRQRLAGAKPCERQANGSGQGPQSPSG